MRSMPLFALCLLLPLMSSCSSSPIRPAVLDKGCSWTKPILISRQDRLTNSTKRQILAFNLTRQQICSPSPKP